MLNGRASLVIFASIAVSCGVPAIPDSGAVDATIAADVPRGDTNERVAPTDTRSIDVLDVRDVIDDDVARVPIDAAACVPLNQRTQTVCLPTTALGNCSFPGPPPYSTYSCASDSDCADAGANGRCVHVPVGSAMCTCSFDTCTSDSQCHLGGPCACSGSTYLVGGNTCVRGNCQIDCDCGSGGECSPSVNPDGCGELGGYYCHTPNDTCHFDGECGETAGWLNVCAYIPANGRWECRPAPVCA